MAENRSATSLFYVDHDTDPVVHGASVRTSAACRLRADEQTFDPHMRTLHACKLAQMARHVRSVTMRRTTHLENCFEIYHCIGRSRASVYDSIGCCAHHRKTAV